MQLAIIRNNLDINPFLPYFFLHLDVVRLNRF